MLSVLAMFVIVTICSVTPQEDVSSIRKCCAKGMQLNLALKKCTFMNSTAVSNIQYEYVSPPFNDSSYAWVPNYLRNNTILVIYNMLDHMKMDLTTVEDSDHSGDVQILDVGGVVDPSFIRDEQDCYDSSNDPRHPRVLMTSYKLLSVNKCCSKGERLNTKADGCESIPGFRSQSISQEVVGVARQPQLFSWLPDNTSHIVLKVNYNIFKTGYDFNTLVRVNSDFSWRVQDTEPFGGTVLTFQGKNVSGNEVSVTTDIFCFDEVSSGSLSPKVILAVVYQVSKCCKQGYQVRNLTPWDLVIRGHSGCRSRVCVPREGLVVRKLNNGFVDWRNDTEDAFWLPETLRSNSIPVRYNVYPLISFIEDSMIFFDENKWTLGINDTSLPQLNLNVRDFFGRRLLLKSLHFCFDYLEGLGRVVITHIPKPKYSITKCCLSGEIISFRGECEKHAGIDWSPDVSPFYSELNDILEFVNWYIPEHRFCAYGRQKIHSLQSAHSVLNFEERPFIREKGRLTSFCNDWQRASDGSFREVVGACTFPELAIAHDKVRPLGAVSAAMLVMAAVVAVVRIETRRSAHGRALACHALCLAAASGLHAARFFHWPKRILQCLPYMYATYFFMVAANWWLTVMSFNIFKNFNQPLGALASAGGLRASARAEWLRFGFMSLVAWGGAVSLTILCITMYNQNWGYMRRLGVIMPSFAETRTCAFENANDILQLFWEVPPGDPMGALCYYFAPVAILAIINATFVFLTARNVWVLRKGTSLVRRAQILRNGLVYVKLLLTTGVLELSLELALWARGRRREGDVTQQAFSLAPENTYSFEIAVTCVDFARALSVLWMSAGCRWGRRARDMLGRGKKNAWAMWERYSPPVTKDHISPHTVLEHTADSKEKSNEHS